MSSSIEFSSYVSLCVIDQRDKRLEGSKIFLNTAQFSISSNKYFPFYKNTLILKAYLFAFQSSSRTEPSLQSTSTGSINPSNSLIEKLRTFHPMGQFLYRSLSSKSSRSLIKWYRIFVCQRKSKKTSILQNSKIHRSNYLIFTTSCQRLSRALIDKTSMLFFLTKLPTIILCFSCLNSFTNT